MTTETTRTPSTVAATTTEVMTTPPGGNGLIAFSFDGDIYVGDPVSGATTRIVTGSESHVNPIFSPDGSEIAFLRGAPVWGPVSLVVVSVDGSDERVVMAEDLVGGRGVGPFAWTPDGSGVVVNVDLPPYFIPGGLGLFDASGDAEPLELTPPLPRQRGAIYFNPSAQVAPMIRPPAGDLILSAGPGVLDVYDADLVLSRRLAESLDFESRNSFGGTTWSPDSAMIAFDVQGELFVMDFESGDLRSLGEGFNNLLWSPDGTSIAFERWRPGPDPSIECWMAGSKCTSVIAIIDLATETERVLEASVAPVKRGAAIETMTNNLEHTWWYEGWSWSPDGQSLLLLLDHRTQPVIVDVATDPATEVPWGSRLQSVVATNRNWLSQKRTFRGC